MKLYNTMSRKAEPFEPRGKEVTLYVCGITPYDTTHIGHAFTYSSFDLLIRYLEMRGLQVKYVENVTDIDDDVLRKAKEQGEDWQALGERWTLHFIDDMVALNIRPPDEYPRATEVIPDIIEWVQNLIDAGVAYASGGNVYFSIDAWPTFGKLCHLSRAEMLPIANQRGNRPLDPHKRDPLDFVLWQAQAPGEPAWPSPWGPGRPGWHIECSTMSTRFLGPVVDIHGGGADLCFPHHECEIAQFEPLHRNQPFVRYWMHTAMVRYKGEKMSKSLGNLVMVADLLREYAPDALRLYLAEHHYREEWTFDEKDLKQAAQDVAQMRQAVTLEGGNGPELNADLVEAAFITHMDDDLNSPGAAETLVTLAHEIIEAARAGRDVKEAQKTLRSLAPVLGLRLDEPGVDHKVETGWKAHALRFQ